MRKINRDDFIFQKMIAGNDDIIFNLFYLIRQGENALLYTDDANYITAQSNYKAPLWIYICGKLSDEPPLAELKTLIKESLTQNPNVHINARQEYFQPVIDLLEHEDGIFLTEYMPMNAYACRKAADVACIGACVAPCTEYKPAMAELIKQMAKDAENKDISEEAAQGFANAMETSPNLFLWKDREIVSMAMIAHKTDKYARINTVVTDRNHRGKGYAGMLVGEMSRALLKNGITPMLYADARNPSSNTAYQKLGYVKAGEITEFMAANEK